MASMSFRALLLFSCALASGLQTLPHAPGRLAALVPRMQTLAPPTIEKPATSLPETWDVPDTFTFPATKSEEPPLYRLTLFKSSIHDVSTIVKALSEIVFLSPEDALRIAKQSQTLGFAVVGEWTQEIAEQYAKGLAQRELVVDVSPSVQN